MTANGVNSLYYPQGYPIGPGQGFPGGQPQPFQAYQQPPVFPFYGGGSPLPLQEQGLFHDPEIARLFGQPTGGLPQQSPLEANRQAGEAVLVEVGYITDGEADEHAQSVQEIYERHNPNGEVTLAGIGNTNTGAKEGKSKAGNAPKLSNQNELNEMIDSAATDAYRVFGEQVDQVVTEGKASVVNGSLGYSRNEVYIDTLNSLQANPGLARHLGLQAADIESLEVDEDGVTTITPEVSEAITRYVDERLDTPGSKYQEARQKYQESTRNAAANGVTVVVAAGNEHELNAVFERSTPGGDTNFLAQSDSVISVAASDDQDTQSLQDDTIGDFSSHGDGVYNPTIATDGVGIETEFGEQDGTSFAAPKVAAVIAQLQKQNPNLTFDQIKGILQGTAVDTQASHLAEGAGILNEPAIFQTSGQGYFPMASGYY